MKLTRNQGLKLKGLLETGKGISNKELKKLIPELFPGDLRNNLQLEFNEYKALQASPCQIPSVSYYSYTIT